MMDSCFFAGSSNISDKRAVVSRQFCGPLGNTFPRWSRAGGTACRQRFALSILWACSHPPPNLSGVPEGMLCPFLDLLIYPLQPGMHSTCSSSALIKLLNWFPNKTNLYLLILPSTFETVPHVSCKCSEKVKWDILRIIWVTQDKHKRIFVLYVILAQAHFCWSFLMNLRYTPNIRRKKAIIENESLR